MSLWNLVVPLYSYVVWVSLVYMNIQTAVTVDAAHKYHKRETVDGQQQQPLRGIIVVPGLGRPDRLFTVIDNLRKLHLENAYTTFDANGNKRDMYWDCVVYIYADRTETQFWSMKKELEVLYSLCDIVENPNKRVAENMYMFQPALLKTAYSKVFLFLDDCKFSGEKTFELQKLLTVMHYNNLTVASPMVKNANKVGGNKFRNILQTEAQLGMEGYVSTFVEIFVWLMTMESYQALWDLLFPSVNPYAWGYDFWYNGYAKQKVHGHKMGIVSTVSVEHVQGEERTDSASTEQKWNAVLAQERHYSMHLGIKLARFRNKLDLKNREWNGAVRGYLSLPENKPMGNKPS